MNTHKPAPQHDRAPEAALSRGLTWRSLTIGLVLLALSVLWIRMVELVQFTCQITEATPPIPALAALIVLLLAAPVRRLLPRLLILTRAEKGIVFLFVAVGSLMSAVGVAQAFLPHLTVPFYFASGENRLGELAAALPEWMGPRDPTVIEGFYAGAPGGVVPWSAWLRPLALWSIFFLLYWWTAQCLWTVFRRRWAEAERLTFPVLEIPLTLTEELGPPAGGGHHFLRSPLLWIGVGISVAYNAFNIAHAFNPAVPALGVQYPIGSVFSERPLSAMRGMQMWYRPELVGLGYLVSLEVLFSVWVFYLLHQLTAVGGLVAGYQKAGFPFVNEQGMGAYAAVILFLIWSARRHLKGVLQCAFGRVELDDSGEPMRYRTAVFGGLAGFGGLVLFATRCGVEWVVAVGFFGYLLAMALAYCRVRCETGTPSVWALPHSQGMKLPFDTFGSRPFLRNGPGPLAGWTSFFWLVHGGFFNQSTVYGMEGMQLCERLGVRRREAVVTTLMAVGIGLAMAFAMFLTTYYQYGANVLAGGQNNPMGGVRIRYCLQAWQQSESFLRQPRDPDWARTTASLVGFAVTAAVIGARSVLLRFPLNPLGYMMACVFGGQYWWAFFVAWLLKVTVLHLGGVRLYRRLIPAFLGLTLGQFFAAGIVWASVAGWWPHATYIVWFT